LNRRLVEQQTPRRSLLKAGAGLLTSAALTVQFWSEAHAQPALADTTQDQDRPNVVIQWNRAAREAVAATESGPTVASRAYAVSQTSIYDAWAAYDSVAVGTRLGNALRRPRKEHTLENKNQAISFAAYRALTDLFPSQTSRFDELMTSLGYNPADRSTNIETPTGIGNVAAQAVLDFRHHDGSNQLGDLHPGAYSDYTGYQPVNTPDELKDVNHWQPLLVPDGEGGFVVQQFLTPQWGRVIPFALTSGSQLRSAPPARYPSEAFLQQAKQVLNISAHLTDRQKVIAEYWNDGPGTLQPAGHWCKFAEFISRRDNHDLDSDVKLFFALTNAIMDAYIATWNTKRFYDSKRPITAIHFLFKEKKVLAWAGPFKGTRLIEGQDWLPYLPTPPFPEYTAGHSGAGGAGAEVMKRFTRSDHFGKSVTLPEGSSFIEPGAVPATDITLSWPTFTAASDEEGISRLFGGVHFVQGNPEGLMTGRSAGALAWYKAQIYINNW
jgi:hypothetical protein